MKRPELARRTKIFLRRIRTKAVDEPRIEWEIPGLELEIESRRNQEPGAAGRLMPTREWVPA